MTDQGPFTPMQASQVGLVWRLARRALAAQSNVSEEEFIDIDHWLESDNGPGDTARAEPAQRHSSGVKERVLKMNSLIDQQDDSELLPPAAADVDRWFQNYVITMGAQPDETEEPTASQLAALSKKVFAESRAPYCDFSVWTPSERRMSRSRNVECIPLLGMAATFKKISLGLVLMQHGRQAGRCSRPPASC